MDDIFYLQLVVFSDLELQMEVERLVVCEFAREQQNDQNQPNILAVEHNNSTESLTNVTQNEKKINKKKSKTR